MTRADNELSEILPVSGLRPEPAAKASMLHLQNTQKHFYTSCYGAGL